MWWVNLVRVGHMLQAPVQVSLQPPRSTAGCCNFEPPPPTTHTHTHARTHACTHPRTPARPPARTHHRHHYHHYCCVLPSSPAGLLVSPPCQPSAVRLRPPALRSTTWS
jgi:hypothetical protein